MTDRDELIDQVAQVLAEHLRDFAAEGVRIDSSDLPYRLSKRLVDAGLLAIPALRGVCDCTETPHERGSRLCMYPPEPFEDTETIAAWIERHTPLHLTDWEKRMLRRPWSDLEEKADD